MSSISRLPGRYGHASRANRGRRLTRQSFRVSVRICTGLTSSSPTAQAVTQPRCRVRDAVPQSGRAPAKLALHLALGGVRVTSSRARFGFDLCNRATQASARATLRRVERPRRPANRQGVNSA